MKRASILLSAALAASAFGQESIEPRPPKRPVPSNDLARLICDTRIGEAQCYRNLAVFPLFTEGRLTRGYWTLDHALGKGLLRISEKGDGSVPELLAENLSDEPVFLMAGEIVTGGKQNRVVSQDILLAPRSGPVSLGVFCVEQGRWTPQSRYFGAEKEMAHGSLRQELNAPHVSQARVWGEVARTAEALAPAEPNETRYLGKVYKDKAVMRDVDEYSRAITWSQDANGMAVVIGGRVVGVELFGDSQTFASLRDKLLRSYAVDAIACDALGEPVGDRNAVQRFLQSAQQARLSTKQTIGIGRLFGIEGRSLYGSILTWHGQRGAYGVVHVSLFADTRPADRPPVVPMPQPRPLPRD